MPINKTDRLAIIENESSRLDYGLYAAELDVRISEASPNDSERLSAANERLANVQARVLALGKIREQVEAES